MLLAVDDVQDHIVYWYCLELLKFMNLFVNRTLNLGLVEDQAKALRAEGVSTGD